MLSFLLMTKDRINEIIEAVKSIELAIKNDILENEYEVIILLNGSPKFSVDYVDEKLTCFFNKEETKKINFHVYHHDNNLGVSGGRNYLYEKSKGDILIFLDDDAEIINYTNFISKIFEIKNSNKNVGIIAAKSIDLNGEIREKEVPVTKEKFQIESVVCEFIGVCHIIFKDSMLHYKKLYPEMLFYGMEEKYLSYRTINDGYDIVYCPDIVVKHKKAPSNRLPEQSYYIFLASNKIYISTLTEDLSKKISHFVLWSCWCIKKTKNLNSLFKMVSRLNKMVYSKEKEQFRIKRNPRLYLYVRKYEGNLWY